MSKFLKGNIAIVEGAIAAGVDAYFGYPITPQNEIIEHMSVRMREENRVFLQAESEIAAINMVFGAALTGKRAMTSSSSPGISLMQESISYIVGCEIPTVIVNVQRGGPGLGNISGAQGDYFQAVKGGGHGDYKMIVLTPYNVQEMYEMTKHAFDLAFKYRNPVIILADGILGQLSEPVDMIFKEEKRKEEEYDWALTGCKNREPRFVKSLVMTEGELEKHNYTLFEKFESMDKEVLWEEKEVEDADVILLGYGTSARVNYDAYLQARKKGLKVGYFRFKTVYPFPSARLLELAKKSKFLVVEMSMGQLVEDVKLACNGETEAMLYGVPGGGVPTVNEILKRLEGM